MKIHWFSITVFNLHEHALDMWQQFFHFELGDLVDTPRTGRGFRHISVGLNEAKLYYDPIEQHESKQYYHFEFTGSSCDCMIPTRFSDFVACLLQDNILFRVTRVDFAFDNAPFSPMDFFDHVVSGDVVSLAKRETLSSYNHPFQLREDGQEGCQGCYLGSKTSERFLRVYNERGYTRVEFVCKDKRADAVVRVLFQFDYKYWDALGRQHLKQYVDFPSWDLWNDFLGDIDKAGLLISPARKVALIKMEKWFQRQVSVALSVYYDVHGWEVAQSLIDTMLMEATNSRNRDRYKSVLALRSPFEPLKNLVPPDPHPDWELFLEDFQAAEG